MDGPHDVGGMHGFGPVVVDDDATPFHAHWEARSYALARAIGTRGLWNIDIGRAEAETLSAAVYYTRSYEERFLLRFENLLVRFGLLRKEELATGKTMFPGVPLPAGAFRAKDLTRLHRRGSFGRQPVAPAKYHVGQIVRTIHDHPASHTRLPRYARGKSCRIERVHGAHVFPDAVVRGLGENPQWLYTVTFDAEELWGADAEPGTSISVEAFEPYLQDSSHG